MATGYQRQSSGLIVTGATIQASHFNNEYDAIEDAFNATTGHNHDGTTGGGSPINLTTSITGTLAVANGGTGATTAANARTNLGVVIGTDVQAYDADLAAIAALSSSGIISRTGAGTAAVRTITAPAAGITVTNGDGVSGNPTLALANDLAAVEGLSGTGLAVRTATDTWASRTITAPASGITVTNGDGVLGNPTLALANDLSALEGLSSTGIAVRTASDTWAQRTIVASGGLTVTNGDGVSGNPSVTISGGRQTLWVPAVAISPSNTGGCASLATSATSANQPDIRSLDFDATTQEYAQFEIGMPDQWNEGTITAQFVWTHGSTTTNFGVVWNLQAVSQGDGDDIAAAYGTAQQVTDTGGTTNRRYITSETSAITIAGSPAAKDIVCFRVSRVATDGSDTLAVDAKLLGIYIYITTNAGVDA